MQNETLATFPTGEAASMEIRSFSDRITKTFAIWKRRHETRRHLAHMSSHMMADIGITEAERLDELDKFFWEK